MARRDHTLAGINLFSDLKANNLDRLNGSCKWRSYEAGQRILSRRDETTDVFFVVSGVVRVAAYSLDGKEVAFRDQGAGEFFGELSAIDGAPRSTDVDALSDAVIPSMTAKAFWKLLQDHPEISTKMLRHLADMTRKLSARVFEFSVHTVKNRIHAELLRLARDQHNGDQKARISPAPRHADIANRISTHREAVTRELNALDRAGVIERRDRCLIVPDIARLARLVDELHES